jgi:Pectate lyase superfamily protein
MHIQAKRILQILALLLGPAAVWPQSYTLTQISAQHLYDTARQPLNGSIVVTLTDANDNPVTYTPQGGSPSTATFTATVRNGAIQLVAGFQPFTVPAAATTTPSGILYRIQTKDQSSNVVWTFPKTPINQQYYSVDGYIAQAAVPISGTGAPSVPRCAGGAQYTDTTSSTVPWACTILTQPDNTTVWTQNPSQGAQCHGTAMAYPLVGNPYCIHPAQAYLLPGYVLGNNGATPAMAQPIVQSGGGGSTPAPPAFAVQLADSTASHLAADPYITINTSNHVLGVGTGSIPGSVSVNGGCTGTCATMTSADGITWNLGQNLSVAGSLSVPQLTVTGCSSGQVPRGDGSGLCITPPTNPLIPSSQFSLFYQPNSGTSAAAQGDPLVTTDGSGNVRSKTTISSVNSQINVKAYPYLAAGNASTDDTAAIQSACDAARTSNPPATVYFPYGQYLTGDLNYHCAGVSMVGQQSGMSLAAGTYTSTLLGKPGQDILHVPDPNTYVGSAPNRSWSIENMTFQVNDTVDPNNRTATDGVTNGTTTVTSATMAFTSGDVGSFLTLVYSGDGSRNVVQITGFTNSTTVTVSSIPTETHTGVSLYIPLASPGFPHRSPGRWVQDVSTNSGSSVYTSTRADFTCGDVGQWMRVVGAGASGADIIAKIPAQTWCSVQQNGATYYSTTVDLGVANQAAATLTNAYGYVSVDNRGPFARIGNCAIAFDNFDGNSANYTMTGSKGNLYPTLKNVSMNTTSSVGRNSSCGFYTSGVWSPYGIHSQHVNITRLDYGVIEATQDTNMSNSSHTGYGTFGNDFQTWEHMFINTNSPLVIYNGCCGRISDIELTGSDGPAILSAGSGFETSAFQWNINITEMEKDYNVGTHISGSQMQLTNTILGTYSALDGTSITCRGCISQTPTNGQATLEVSGTQNEIHMMNQIDHVTVTTNGPGNRVYGTTAASSTYGQRNVMLSPTSSEISMDRRADFLLTNPLTPFMNLGNLRLVPHDIKCHAGQVSANPIVADATSPTGYYLQVTSGQGCNEDQWYPLQPTLAGLPVIGGVTPVLGAGKYQWVALVKCPSITSFTRSYYIKTLGGTNVAGPISLSSQACSTGYTTIRDTVDLSSYGGGVNYVWAAYPTTGEIDIAWEGWRPFADDYNGYTPESTANKGQPNGYASLDGSGNVAQPVASAPKLTTHGSALQAWTTASDGVTQQWGTVGGTIPNTLGCLDGYDHLPCTIAKIDTTYTGTAGVASTIFYTNSTGGTLLIRLTGMSHVTTIGTAGTMQFNSGVTSSATQCGGNSGVSLSTGTSSKYNSGAGGGTACAMALVNGDSVYYGTTFTGATGTPTIEIHAFVERME